MSLQILFAVPSYAPAVSWGGPVESTHRLCQALLGLGAGVRVLTTDATVAGETLPYPADRWLRHEGVPVRYCRRYLSRTFSPTFLRHLAPETRRADLVHIGSVFNSTIPASMAAAAGGGKPFVLTPRGSLDPWSLGVKSWKKRPALALLRPLLRRAAALHATSVEERAGIERLGLGPPVRMIPNGVDVGQADAADRRRPTWRRRLEIPARTPLLLILGRLHPKKGIGLGIETLARLGSAGRPAAGGPAAGEARLILAGPDNDRHLHDLEALAESRGVGPRVRWVGPVVGRDKYQLLAEADLLLLPSEQENFGNVVVEAMSVGTPVIASRATPWRVLEERGLGRWVERTAESFAAAVLEVLAAGDDGELRARRRRLIDEEYTWPSIARRMAEVYREIVDGR